MRTLFLGLTLAAGLSLSASAQEPGNSTAPQASDDELTARRIFYREPRDDEKLPPVPVAATAPKPRAQRSPGTPVATAPAKPVRPAATRNAGQTVRPNAGLVAVNNPGPTSPVQPVSNLGLRYSVLLVNIKTGERERVDSDRKFRKGECVAFEFESNRSGYLYVLTHGSSGRWDALLPSPQMPDEANIIRSRTPVTVPGNYCFEILDPPGVDRFFVIVARDANEVYPLHDSIRKQKEAPMVSPPSTLMAVNRLEDEITIFEGELRSRDVRVMKIGAPQERGEAEHSVYVANAGAEKPSNLVTEIRIDHR